MIMENNQADRRTIFQSQLDTTVPEPVWERESDGNCGTGDCGDGGEYDGGGDFL